MGSTGVGANQDMLAPDCSPIHLGLFGQGRFKPCRWLGYIRVMDERLYVEDLWPIL